MAKSTVAVKFTGDVASLKKATQDAEGALSGFAKKAGSTLKAGLLGAGAIGAAALTKGFTDALSQEKSIDKAAAALGLSPEESEQLGKIAGKLYADAYGESFGEVADAVATVQSELEGLGAEELESATAHALDFATVFDQDINESIGAAGLLLRNGLVEDGEEAFDLLTAVMRDVPRAARDEVLAATTEYSTFFADLGISGREAFGAIAQAAEEGGAYGVDKLGDAVKEFGIRATDMSTASVDAFEAVGLNAEDMATKIFAGGETAREAFYEVVQGLQGMEDPLEQSQAAIALFGTPLEDLSSGEIPEFLSSLDNMGDALENVEGAADDMGNTLNDNTATKIESFKRKALQKLAEFVADKVIPALEEFSAWFQEEMQPRIEEMVRVFEEEWLPVLEEMWRTFHDDIIPILEAFAAVVDRFVLPAMGNFVIDVLEGIEAMVNGWRWLKETFVTVQQTIGNVIYTVMTRFDELVAFVFGLPGRIGSAASGMWTSVKDAAYEAAQYVLRQIDRMLGPLDEIAGKIARATSFGGGGGGGGSLFNRANNVLGRLPFFASGVQNFGGGLAVVGERGPELVSLPTGSNVYSTGETRSMLAGHSNADASPVKMMRDVIRELDRRATANVTINVEGAQDPESIARHVSWALAGR